MSWKSPSKLNILKSFRIFVPKMCTRMIFLKNFLTNREKIFFQKLMRALLIDTAMIFSRTKIVFKTPCQIFFLF